MTQTISPLTVTLSARMPGRIRFGLAFLIALAGFEDAAGRFYAAGIKVSAS